jgi:hypothetical protein
VWNNGMWVLSPSLKRPCVFLLSLGPPSLPLAHAWASLLDHEKPNAVVLSHPSQGQLQPSGSQLTCQLTSDLWASPFGISGSAQPDSDQQNDLADT